jgi:hypothetical protein
LDASKITLDHIRQAAEWAKTAQEPQPLDGMVRKYHQGDWDCGTSCCMWGAACILAGEGPAASGPPGEWAKSPIEIAAVGIMRSGMSTPDQMLALLRGANLSGADLSGANLSDADLRGADLSGANLSGANLNCANLSGTDLSGTDLSGANLSDADLRGADLRGANLNCANLSGTLIWLGNRIAKLQ